MHIRTAKLADIEDWATLRAELWPSGTVDEHRQEAASAVSSGNDENVSLVAVDGAGRVCGFAEAALRHDYVNGCETSPVAFLEGIYVGPKHRRAGLGRELCSAVESWGRTRGCKEMASDALLDNHKSHVFHSAVGFAETERVVYFRKTL
jgi:aminoglycoside 6'-N-acetyltransferase I